MGNRRTRAGARATTAAQAPRQRADDEHQTHPLALVAGPQHLGERRQRHVPPEGKRDGDEREAREEPRLAELRRPERRIQQHDRPRKS